MPHESAKIHRRIAKTSLGAEASQPWRHVQHLEDVLQDLRGRGYTLAAIEQAPNSFPLPKYNSPEKIALLVGREVEGVEPEVLVQMDIILEIPMRGKKESFNVAQAAAMALYHCAFVKSTTMIY